MKEIQVAELHYRQREYQLKYSEVTSLWLLFCSELQYGLLLEAAAQAGHEAYKPLSSIYVSALGDFCNYFMFDYMHIR